jgi:CDGSH-type Zn-finger protein
MSWQKKPFRIEVKQGDSKAFCTCGKSKSGPYCDGSHEGSEHSPNVIKFEEDKTVSICGCLQSQNAPFCDGVHSKL